MNEALRTQDEIYKGRTRCHQLHHPMESATAIFTGRNYVSIYLNVERCKECGKFYMSYSVYQQYRDQYGIMLGKIKMDSLSIDGIKDVHLSEFSPLNLCGYNVSQQDGFSAAERQYVIAKVIDTGILSKQEIVQYLECFINRNGQKLHNELALAKWEEDLVFTINYQIMEQDKHKIKTIIKY